MNNTGENHAQDITSSAVSTIFDASDLVEDYDEARETRRVFSERLNTRSKKAVKTYLENKAKNQRMADVISYGVA